MVQLSREIVEQFKEVARKEYGVEYSDEEASEAAHNLVNYFDLLSRIDGHKEGHR